MTGLDCGHLYCTTCWTEYLTVKIMDEGASQSIQCPTGDCQMLVDDATVLRLVKDARVTLKYQHLITSSFVTVRLNEGSLQVVSLCGELERLPLPNLNLMLEKRLCQSLSEDSHVGLQMNPCRCNLQRSLIKVLTKISL